MTSESDPVEVLNESECWSVLRTVQLGRLAVSTPAGVDIFPINFVIDHGTVVFRTAAGTKFSAALSGEPVAFEADGQEVGTQLLWSVVIHGNASEIRDRDEALDALRLPLTPAQAARKPRFLRITPRSVTGRRFELSDPEVWTTPISHSPRAAVD